jgi:hypothetical protein
MKDRGNWIKTFTGQKFYVLDPMPEEVYIEDIAHALSNQCRFGGHVKDFYSVAEHCYNVSILCSDHFKLDGLLHDASEAYLVDIPRPIKHMIDLDGYRRIETLVQNCIDWKWDVAHANAKPQDNQMLAFEIRELMLNPLEYNITFPNSSFGINCWEPKRAERNFLERFYELRSNSTKAI